MRESYSRKGPDEEPLSHPVDVPQSAFSDPLVSLTNCGALTYGRCGNCKASNTELSSKESKHVILDKVLRF